MKSLYEGVPVEQRSFFFFMFHNRMITESLAQTGTDVEVVRQHVLQLFDGVPLVFCYDGILPFEMRKMIMLATITSSPVVKTKPQKSIVNRCNLVLL